MTDPIPRLTDPQARQLARMYGSRRTVTESDETIFALIGKGLLVPDGAPMVGVDGRPFHQYWLSRLALPALAQHLTREAARKAGERANQMEETGS